MSLILCAAGPHGMELDAAAKFEEAGIAIGQYRLEPPLEQVADPVMGAIEVLGDHPVDVPHAGGEIAVDGFREQVV